MEEKLRLIIPFIYVVIVLVWVTSVRVLLVVQLRLSRSSFSTYVFIPYYKKLFDIKVSIIRNGDDMTRAPSTCLLHGGLKKRNWWLKKLFSFAGF